LLNFLKNNGFSSNIDLLFNTNATFFSDEIKELLKSFKKVRMYFSIDDIEKRFEYQRKGAEWNQVVKNLKSAYEFSRSPDGQNMDFKICCTVSSLNIYYFPEFFNFFNQNFPGLKVFWNFLFDPWELSIQALPDEVKEIISKRLQQEITTTYEMREESTKTIQELITFLNHKLDMPFEQFFRHVNRHDVCRKESFSETFPEFWKLIENNKPKDLAMGTYSELDLAQMDMIANADKYDNLKMFEEIRKAHALSKADEHLNSDYIITTVLKTFEEVNTILQGPHEFHLKLRALEPMLRKNEIGTDSFLEDLFVFGIFKFYKSLSEMNVDEMKKLLARKYPNQSVLLTT